MNQDEVQKLRKEIESGMEDLDRQDTQSKGFETLMNEELEKQKSEMGRHKKKKA
jgi:predicted  nucleic acid-binding Zn-ribbon protein